MNEDRVAGEAISCHSNAADELRALLNWIEEYAAAIGASETLFGMYDAEEEHSGAESQAR